MLENKKYKLLEIKEIVNEDGELKIQETKEIKEPKIKFAQNSRFSKAYQCREVCFDNKSYYKYWYLILKRLDMNTNMVVKHGISKKENIPLTQDDFLKIFDCGVSTLRKFLSECNDKDYLKDVVVGGEFICYVVNPIYEFNGEYISPFLYQFFKEKGIKDYITKSGVKTMDEYIQKVETCCYHKPSKIKGS